MATTATRISRQVGGILSNCLVNSSHASSQVLKMVDFDSFMEIMRQKQISTYSVSIHIWTFLYLSVQTCPQEAWKRQHTPKPPAQPPLGTVVKILISTKVISLAKGFGRHKK